MRIVNIAQETNERDTYFFSVVGKPQEIDKFCKASTLDIDFIEDCGNNEESIWVFINNAYTKVDAKKILVEELKRIRKIKED